MPIRTIYPPWISDTPGTVVAERLSSHHKAYIFLVSRYPTQRSLVEDSGYDADPSHVTQHWKSLYRDVRSRPGSPEILLLRDRVDTGCAEPCRSSYQDMCLVADMMD